MAFWDEQIAAAVANSGPTIVRIVGDMACVKGSFAEVDEMLIFERLVGAIIARSPSSRFASTTSESSMVPSLLEAIKAHPEVSNLGFAKFVT